MRCDGCKSEAEAMQQVGGVALRELARVSLAKSRSPKRRSGAVHRRASTISAMPCGFLRGNPGFAAIAVGTLAFGIGGNTAIFTMADALALRGLPYPRTGPADGHRDQLAAPERDRAVDRPRWISSICAPAPNRSPPSRPSAPFGATFSPAPDPPNAWKRSMSRRVSSRCWARSRRWAEPSPRRRTGLHGKPVAVLSHAFWERRFGARRDILGRAITLNGAPFTVIGVLRATSGISAIRWPARPPKSPSGCRWRITSSSAHRAECAFSR